MRFSHASVANSVRSGARPRAVLPKPLDQSFELSPRQAVLSQGQWEPFALVSARVFCPYGENGIYLGSVCRNATTESMPTSS